MALQASPPISLNDIKAEFGATGTRSITEFYRGGAFVPNTAANSGVPTSGQIDLLDFLGAANYAGITAAFANLSATYSDPTNPNPPRSRVVYGYPNISASGGTGSYTYAWSIVSGPAAISGATTGSGVTIYATVNNWDVVSGTIQCVVSDGVTSKTFSGTYTLRYEAGQPV